LLPIVEIAIWIVMVPAEAGLTFYRLHGESPGSERFIDVLGWNRLAIPRDRLLPSAITLAALDHSQEIIAADLPGLLADFLISLPTAQPGKWHPAAIPLDAWRCLVFPFYCLPAWWFVGLGLDGLFGGRRLHRCMPWIGLALAVLSFAAVFGYVTAPPRDQADLRWLLPGFIFWALAFGALPLNWLRRRGTQKSDTPVERSMGE
jgi:hypothetical protein